MRQALLIIDVQPGFNSPKLPTDGIRPLLGTPLQTTTA